MRRWDATEGRTAQRLRMLLDRPFDQRAGWDEAPGVAQLAGSAG